MMTQRKRKYIPNHPSANGQGYVYNHILVVEDILGRHLDRRHPIHHVNEDKLDDSPHNLVVCEDKVYHHLLHRRTKALRECGDASAMKCVLCGEYTTKGSNTYYWVLKTGTERLCHKKCANKRRKKTYRRTGN